MQVVAVGAADDFDKLPIVSTINHGRKNTYNQTPFYVTPRKKGVIEFVAQESLRMPVLSAEQTTGNRPWDFSHYEFNIPLLSL